MGQKNVKIIAVADLEAEDREEALEKLAGLLKKEGCVKESFLQALLEREKNFPTGLELEGKYNVALAHADPQHVIRTGFAIGVLKQPVVFRNMGNPDDEVEVKIVFVMAAADSKEVISSLRKLTEDVFQKPDVVETIGRAEADSFLQVYVENIICE